MDDAVPAGFVRLRVGVTVFEVSRDVLLSEPDSVFVAMLSGEWASRQGGSSSAAERPPMVFDRDPQASTCLLPQGGRQRGGNSGPAASWRPCSVCTASSRAAADPVWRGPATRPRLGRESHCPGTEHVGD